MMAYWKNRHRDSWYDTVQYIDIKPIYRFWWYIRASLVDMSLDFVWSFIFCLLLFSILGHFCTEQH